MSETIIPGNLFEVISSATGLSVSCFSQGELNFKFYLRGEEEEGKGFWTVNYSKDSYGNPKSSESEIHRIRGWIFDHHGNLIVKGFPYTKKLIWAGDQYDPIFSEEGLKKHSDNPNSVFKFLPQGPTLMVFKYGGVVYFSTFRSLDVHRAVYGGSENFLKLFLETVQMSQEEFSAKLFGEKPFSNVVHFFALCHKSLMPCYFGPGSDFVCYLGAYAQEMTTNFQEDFDFEDRCSLEFSEPGNFSGLVKQDIYTEEEVREMLNSGREVLLVENGQGYRIQSKIQNLREIVMDNQPNLALLVCENLSKRYEDSIYQTFNVKDDTEANMNLLLNCVSVSRREELQQIISDVMNGRELMIEKILTMFKNAYSVTNNFGDAVEKFFNDLEEKFAKAVIYTNKSRGEEVQNHQYKRQLDRVDGRLRTIFTFKPHYKNSLEGFCALIEQRLRAEHSNSLYAMIFKFPKD